MKLQVVEILSLRNLRGILLKDFNLIAIVISHHLSKAASGQEWNAFT